MRPDGGASGGGGLEREPLRGGGSGARAPAGCGAEPREEKIGLLSTQKHPKYTKVAMTSILHSAAFLPTNHIEWQPCLALLVLLLGTEGLPLLHGGRAAHSLAFCTSEALAAALRSMPMYTAMRCRVVACDCRKQCIMTTARSAPFRKMRVLSEEAKCPILASGAAGIFFPWENQSCRTRREKHNGTFVLPVLSC